MKLPIIVMKDPWQKVPQGYSQANLHTVSIFHSLNQPQVTLPPLYTIAVREGVVVFPLN